MNKLTDLNEAALAFVDKGDTQALARCVEYSLQPERILDAIYQRKNYHCLSAVAPLFTLLFKLDQQHPLCVSILLDLFERKEYTVLAAFPSLDDLDINFFIDQALERKIALNFDVCPFFTLEYQTYYYEGILANNCLELFLVHEQEIKISMDEDRFYKILTKNRSLQILRRVGINKEQCKWCVSILLNSLLSRDPKGKEMELLVYLCSLYDHQKLLSGYLLASFYNNDLPGVKLVLRLGVSVNEVTKGKMIKANPTLYAELFVEDV